MGIRKEIKNKKELLNKKFAETLEIEAVLNPLVDVLGKRIKLKKEVESNKTRTLVEMYGAPTRREVISYGGNDSSVELDTRVENHLQGSLDETQEALDIVTYTKGSLAKKFEYVVNAKKNVNRQLVNNGYFEEVQGFVQKRLKLFVEEQNIQYFNLNVYMSKSAHFGFVVEMLLDKTKIPLIGYFNKVSSVEESFSYPMLIELSTSYELEDILYDDSSIHINSLENIKRDLLKTIKEYNAVEDFKNGKEHEELGKLNWFMRKKQVKDAEEIQRLNLSHIVHRYADLVKVQEELKCFTEAVEYFDSHSGAILKEQEVILNYLGNLLKVDIQEGSKQRIYFEKRHYDGKPY